MMIEVYMSLFVGDGESPNADLKAKAGYVPGPTSMECSDCGDRYLGLGGASRRCLDCALVEIIDNWCIVHAAKEPRHRDALGYTGRGAPKENPEYLIARRGNELMLNLVDMAKVSPEFTDPIFTAAHDFMREALADGKQVLIHCNEGKSRAPTIAMLYLMDRNLPFDEAMEKFREIYPAYDPGAGMLEYARNAWSERAA